MESAGEHQSKTVALRSGQTTLVVEGPVRSFGTVSLFRISRISVAVVRRNSNTRASWGHRKGLFGAKQALQGGFAGAQWNGRRWFTPRDRNSRRVVGVGVWPPRRRSCSTHPGARSSGTCGVGPASSCGSAQHARGTHTSTSALHHSTRLQRRDRRQLCRLQV